MIPCKNFKNDTTKSADENGIIWHVVDKGAYENGNTYVNDLKAGFNFFNKRKKKIPIWFQILNIHCRVYRYYLQRHFNIYHRILCGDPRK